MDAWFPHDTMLNKSMAWFIFFSLENYTLHFRIYKFRINWLVYCPTCPTFTKVYSNSLIFFLKKKTEFWSRVSMVYLTASCCWLLPHFSFNLYFARIFLLGPVVPAFLSNGSIQICPDQIWEKTTRMRGGRMGRQFERKEAALHEQWTFHFLYVQ